MGFGCEKGLFCSTLGKCQRMAWSLEMKMTTFNVLFVLTGARELVKVARKTGPDDLLNSAIAGFGTGALLGSLQG